MKKTSPLFTFVAIFLSSLGLSLSAFSHPVERSDQLSLVNYNIQIWPFYGDAVNPPNHKDLRIELIPDRLGPNFDVIFFNEIFDKGLREKLTKKMLVHYPYWADVANNHDPIVLSSGVMVFSKWPIIQKSEEEYGECHIEECLAKKGILHIKINKNGRYYNLFGTHPQSDNDADAWKTRAKQMRELKAFIDAQNIPENEPVILAGDFNINSLSDLTHKYPEFEEPVTELTFTEKVLNIDLLKHEGLPFSFDAELNKMTALSKSNKGVREALDHIWVVRDHKTPNLLTSTESYTQLLSDKSEMKSTPDLSDHFPVMGALNYEY